MPAKRTSNTTGARNRIVARKPATAATNNRRAVAPGRPSANAASASERIDQRIAALGDWRGETLARVRALVRQADPAMTEDVKWVKPTNPWGVAAWSHDGIVATGEVYKNVVKVTFNRGASIPDPARLFNSSMEGNARRAIDIREGEKIEARAFKALVKAAVAANGASVKRATPAAKEDAPSSKRAPVVRAKPSSNKTAKVTLLAGGNPQIARGDGDAPVQAYIAAMPGWTRDAGARLDAIITRSARGVRKAVKWNSPFYGIEGRGWFLNFHVFTKYVKVTFFAGASLSPVPPGSGKDKDARWVDIYEGDLDEPQMAKWAKQAAKLPGWDPGKRG